ncbi:hypothetical protein EVAR_102794_1 [Eumeta japonica]|uniref:Uncharacterized protein n=1 Tax=Eumeta variegata TaxID=151549 RepID=A0A4C1TJ65_EUMVA|nr:hypothetical protein EVAR_102794_1 [Eumeta japonica]
MRPRPYPRRLLRRHAPAHGDNTEHALKITSSCLELVPVSDLHSAGIESLTPNLPPSETIFWDGPYNSCDEKNLIQLLLAE